MRRAAAALVIGFLAVFRLWAQPAETPESTCGRAFAPIPSYPAENSPYGIRQIVSADFDMNGRPDIAQVGSTASVILSAPDGSFGLPIPFYAQNGADLVAVGDFDSNGKADLVYTGYLSVGTMLGNGDGTFTQGPTISLETFAFTIVTGYFNDDSFLDVGVAAAGEPRLFIFLGNGDGSFGPSVEYALGDQTGSIVSADVNGDGKTDLVAADAYSGSLSILIGNGDGTFQPFSSLPLNLPPNSLLGSLTAADLDADGSSDLVVAFGPGILVLLNDGAGNFSPPTPYPSDVFGGEVVVRDFDLDGTPDVLTNGSPSAFYYESQGLVLFHGNGDGTFERTHSWAVPSTASSLVVGDFNQDGKPDVITAADRNLLVLLHRDPGIYQAPLLAYNVWSASPGSDASLGDLNGDGHLDAVIFGSGNLTILLGDGTGSFALRQSFALTYNSGKPAIGQFDADGHPDIAVPVADATIAVLRALGDGSFADPVFYPVPATYWLLRAGRIDGDAFDDLAVAYQIYPTEFGFHLLLSNGDGTFRDGGTVQTVGYLPIDALLTDLDGDGNLDIASVDGASELSVLLGNGNGTFQNAVGYHTQVEPDTLAAGDLTGDHVTDLLVGSVPSLSVTVFAGAGDGTFTSSTELASPIAPQGLSITDLDRDGKTDILVTGGFVEDRSRTGIEVYVGAGGGVFQSPQLTPLGIRPLRGELADVDENGTLDLAYAEPQGYGLVIVPSNVLGAVVHDVSAIASTQAVLTVSAAGLGSLSYQWRKGGVPLTDGGPISGSTTATLMIDPVAFTDAGSYDVVVTDSCGSAISNAATLSIEFDDVPLSNPFHDDIITIATAGITTGCTATSYCPSADVSRAEMAVFLLKAKFGSDHVPPPPGGQIFNDVPPGSFAEEWIAELAALGITAGCGNGNYCPNDPVTRAEMAVFLLKTLLGSGYVPPPATGIFADVPLDHFAIDWIEDLYLRGITAGCNTGPLRYCPDQAVPREQMATFLVRTFLTP